MAWAFSDSQDFGVYTTRQVFVDGEPVSLVSHDLDGDWQFLHDDDGDDDGELRDEEDLLLVRLRDVVERFPDIKQLADLPIGWMASRETSDAPWIREPQPKEWATD
jgi:hypothetical protein